MKSTVTILGCGNCFTANQVNTSFIVTRDKETYLIDCGYNVFQELLTTYPKVVENLTSIWITHLHPDHVGSLGALILYRYFIQNKQTKIFVGKELKNDLHEYLRITASCSRKIDGACSSFIQEAKNVYFINPEDEWANIIFVPVLHGPTTAYGIWVPWNRMFFTGDCYLIPNDNEYLKNAEIIFHDCFMHDQMTLIHSPYEVIKAYYPKQILKKLIFVHHGLLYSQVYRRKDNFGISGLKIIL